jgi:hypothetical protein
MGRHSIGACVLPTSGRFKALVWQDAAGATWLSYNGPAWLAQRHGLGSEVDATVSAMTAALDAIAKATTAAA